MKQTLESPACLDPGRSAAAECARGWRDALTVPNALSVARLILGLCFPLFPASWRLPVIVVAVLTDLLDGATGRLFGVCTRMGRVLDPIADKVFVAGVMGTLLWEGTLTLGDMALVGVRDLVVIAGTLAGLLLQTWPTFDRMAPTLLGKATTAAQFAFFLVLVAAAEYKGFVLALTASLSILAGAQYLWLFVAHRSPR